ncbi:hypothetical protein [Parasitella parasitica]|uniref:Uncharacterized protein n=1 Tax=Parasitella parasitica TaxID=35722 RepID=A0A0B7N7S8_9FUNG|nr:hypothetical protein [Parasitella parasitica]
MRQAVTLSGVLVNANNTNRVLMIPEAEAVAIACAKTIKAKAEEALSVRDEEIYYFICDLGGGTSDMSMYKVSKESGDNKIVQITPNDGVIAGSHSLDDAFIELARVEYHKQEVSPSPAELAHIGYEFARTTKIDYDGSKEVEFKQDFIIQRKTVQIHITNQELKDKVFNPIFSKIIDTIDRILKEATTRSDLIYFSGGLSLAKKLFKRKQRIHRLHRNQFVRKRTVIGMLSLVPQRLPWTLILSLSAPLQELTFWKPTLFLTELIVHTSVENNGFTEYQLSLPAKGNDAISLVSDDRITPTHTFYIALADVVVSENKSFKIRIYPNYSIIELVFKDAIYRLVGFEAVKVGTPMEEQIHYFSEEKKNLEGKAR